MSSKLYDISGNCISVNEAIRIANLHCGDDHMYRSLNNVCHPSTIRDVTTNDISPYDGFYKMMRVIKSNCIAMLGHENLITSNYLDENTFYDDMTKCILISSKFMVLYEKCMDRALKNEMNNAGKQIDK